MEYIDWSKLDSTVCVKKTDKNYLFYHQLQQIDRLSQEFIHSRNQRESIIGIMGDRGSGKSSLLRTVEEKLKENYFSLGVLDPSVFDDSMTIIELFTSQIYQKFKKLNRSEQPIGDTETLFEKLKKITKILADYKVGSESFYHDYAYAEILQNLEIRVNMMKLIDDLVTQFLKYVNLIEGKKYDKIAIYIDDVDIVSNEKVFNVLEDIRKYLAGNVLVVIAYRPEQLFESVLHEKIKENSVLLEKSILTVEQLKDQVSRYLEKLIPIHNRVEVLNTENLLSVPLDQLLYDLKAEDADYDASVKKIVIEDGDLSVKDWIYHALEKRIRIKLLAVDVSENTIYNLPENLRGILQLIRMINEEMKLLEFREIESDRKQTLISYTETLLNNIKIYRSYLKNNLSGKLSTKFNEIVVAWLGRDFQGKNYYACNAVTKIIGAISKSNTEYKSEYQSVLKYSLYQIYNVTLGDVHRVLEVYKNVDSGIEGRYFVYAMKVLYSLELLTQYISALRASLKADFAEKYGLKAYPGENYIAVRKPNLAAEYKAVQKYLSNYLDLVNAKIIFDDFSFLMSDSNQTLNIKYTDVKRKDQKEPQLSIDHDLYSYLLYTDISASGNIRRALNSQYDAKSGNKNSKSRMFYTFQYRRMVNYDLRNESANLINGYAYPIDPFAFLGQKWYVEKTIRDIINVENKRNYVFYSMFDIDIFIRLNYGGDSKNPQENLKKIIDKINLLFIGKIPKRVAFEQLLANQLSNNIFYESVTSSGGQAVYSEDLLKQIDDIAFVSEIKDFKMNKEKALINLRNILAVSDLSTEDRQKASVFLEKLSIPKSQVSNEIKKFVRDACAEYGIELRVDEIES